MVTRILIALLRWKASLRGRRALARESVTSIYVVELTRLGDVIVMLSAMNRLRKNFSGASLRVVVDQRCAVLVSLLEPTVDVIGVDAPATIRGLLQGMRAVRSRPVSLVISASPARRNALVALASGARNIAGYLSHRDSFTPFLEMTPVETYGFPAQEPEYYSRENIYVRMERILGTLGCVTKPAPLSEVVDWKNTLQNGSNGHFPHLSEQYVILFPQAGWEYREWGIGNFLALGERIVSATEYAVVMVLQDPQMHPLPETKGAGKIHVVSGIPLSHVAELIRHSSLLVANDSGPVHLGAALGVPIVALYGPASPELTAPDVRDSVFLYRQVECSPCDQRQCIRPDNSCMKQYTVEEVVESVTSKLHMPVKHG